MMIIEHLRNFSSCIIQHVVLVKFSKNYASDCLFTSYLLKLKMNQLVGSIFCPLVLVNSSLLIF